MPVAASEGLAPRLLSLDVFRGATIALMILVNNAGDWGKTYAPLLHAEWHGWTPTDLVFPFFLFIVGVAIPFALGPRLAVARGAERRDMFDPPALPAVDPASDEAAPRVASRPLGLGPLRRKVLRRAAIIFGLGLFAGWFPFYTVVWERARIPGVLQRIAIVYAVAALAYIYLGPRVRALFAASLLAGYWALMKLVPVPGFGAGDLSAQGNLAFWLDHQLLGSHTWRYAPGPGDPEGILSTLPAIASTLIGIVCGELLRSRASWTSKLWRLLAFAGVATAGGLALARFFPINKNLWSPSYVVFTSGLAFCCLAAIWWLIDVVSVERWSRPLAIFGRNSIFAFVGSGLLAKILMTIQVDPAGGLSLRGLGSAAGDAVSLQKWLYTTGYAAHLPDYVASLAWALSVVLLWLAITAVLDRRGIHLKV